MRIVLKPWKYPSILLFGIGISNIGMWIYFIALNVIVFNMTGSALAVALLYIIKPLATLVTNLWSGSIIDRLNKKHFMILLDLLQGILITCLAVFYTSLWVIYILVFFINMASSIYRPCSVSYMTRLIPTEQRQKFNSLRSLLDSGAFFIGPAITGLLFMSGSPILAIYINAFAFFFSATVTLFMPNLEKNSINKLPIEPMSLTLLKKDWKVVMEFSRKYIYVITIYFLFSGFVVLQTAIDSLEVAFAKEVLSLTDGEYGFLVSIAGAGILVGAIINVVFTKNLSISLLIGLGSFTVAIGYIIFAFSNSFLMASLGVFILAFANAFANTGFFTFYQNNIPVDVMGRIGSMYGFVEAFLVIVTTSIFAVTAHLISVEYVVVSGAFITLVLTTVLLFVIIKPSKRKYHDSSSMEKFQS
ncbi:MFS transporter [Salipaludibacillus neizhouensis]|uniref:MFS transporter n=1 Tax=Salipaludibacillus neizhouensis TaxID=885475 RepID=A0A3A9KDV9_9BACI|nr:MFS transporter [Salipaludibacillus neizhouensis]RKL67823.1 MFS transporter [Salipaludibacillus neizhouensis]